MRNWDFRYVRDARREFRRTPRLGGCTSRHGFTLVELLVVIAIIGILVALLLPAIQAARAAARRTQCQSNLKQIALALLNFHDANKEFPEGMHFDVITKAGVSPDFRPNWIISILPNMEEQALYDSFNFEEFISHADNREARGSQVPTLLCPEDMGAAGVPFIGAGPIKAKEGDNWARGNYACNGDNEYADEPRTKDPQRIGVMRINKTTKISQIIDGTSHTLMAAEIRIGLSERDRRGVWAMGASGASNLTNHGFGSDSNGPNPANESSDDIRGCLEVMAKLGAQTLTLERMTCCEDCDASRQAAPRSRHAPGGVHVAMCDGSVHWIGDDINTTGALGECCSVWDRLVAAQDGLPVELE
jgi:prepilin-type N-terminal cleavage/methylation domain-containing protein